MKLSIVIPLYNEEEILSEMIKIIASGCDKIIGTGEWQFILVNNGSTDRTRRVRAAGPSPPPPGPPRVPRR